MSWRTSDEIKFLMKIGTFGNPQRNPKVCLEGYIEGSKLRKNWEKIDKKEAVKTAKSLLRTVP